MAIERLNRILTSHQWQRPRGVHTARYWLGYIDTRLRHDERHRKPPKSPQSYLTTLGENTTMPSGNVASDGCGVSWPLALNSCQKVTLRRDEATRWQPRIAGADDPQSIFKKANPVVDILSALNEDDGGELPYFDISPVVSTIPGFQPSVAKKNCRQEKIAVPSSQSHKWIVHGPPEYSPTDQRRMMTKYSARKALKHRRVLRRILDHLSGEDLRSAALVNRDWNIVATQSMWKTVMVDSVRRILLTLPEWRGEPVSVQRK